MKAPSCPACACPFPRSGSALPLCGHTPRRGFTLIELLVGVAVIAILLTLIMATIPSVLENGRTAKCTANLRALGLVFSVYLNDHDRQYPAGYKAPGGWPQEFVDKEYASVDLFRCPSNTENPDTYHGTWSHYGYNYAHIATQIRQSGQSGNRTPVNQSDIISPASTVLLVETLRSDRSKSSYLVWDAYSSSAAEMGNPEPRHRNAFNVLWADGHVSAVSAPDARAAYDSQALGAYLSPTSKWKIK